MAHHGSGDHHREEALARAAMLIDHYSLQITDVVEAVLGAGASGNREVQVLIHLVDHPGCRPHELMAVTGASRPGLAGLVGRLERLGLVARADGRDDRRTRVTSLTTRGRRRLAALDEALAHHFVEAGPLAKEIVELLDVELGPGDATRSALDVTGRLASAGAPYADELDRIVGLTGHRQRLALSTLLTWGSARPTQLAEVLGLTSGGLTYLMDQLEADGLVERVSGNVATDRRAVVITLAPDGVEAARVMCDALERNAGPIAAALAATLHVTPAG